MILVRRHHDLGLAKAKRLAEAMACRLQEDYGGTYTWEGHELRFQRTGATARVSRGHDQGGGRGLRVQARIHHRTAG
jgi:hypothetical protein